MNNKIFLISLAIIGLTGCGNSLQTEINKGINQEVDDLKKTEDASGENLTTNLVENKFKVPNRAELDPQTLKIISQPNPGLKNSDQVGFESKKGIEPVAVLFSNSGDLVGKEMLVKLEKYPELVPGGVNLLKVDFDLEKDLRTMLKVEQAGTWVIFDKTGKEISRLNTNNFDGLIMELNKAVIQ